MEKAWSIKKYKNGDEKRVLKLYEGVYHKVKDKEKWMRWWVWQHKKSPVGSPIIWFADDNGKLAGQYEVIRIKMTLGDDTFYASHSQDTMTHPDYRRQGIFVVLANKTYDQGTEEGVELVIGFPNEFSHPGFVNKLKWFDVCMVPRMFKPFNIEKTFKRRINKRFLLKLVSGFAKIYIGLFKRPKKPQQVKGLKISRASSFDKSIDVLWESTSGDYNAILQTRTSDYLNWRYVDHPNNNYIIIIAKKGKKSVGYVVLNIVEKEDFKGGEIVDIFGKLDEDIIYNLLNKASEFFLKEKADCIYCWLPSNKLIKKMFKRNGYIYHPPTPPFIVRNNTGKFTDEYLKDINTWYITMGDSDHH